MAPPWIAEKASARRQNSAKPGSWRAESALSAGQVVARVGLIDRRIGDSRGRPELPRRDSDEAIEVPAKLASCLEFRARAKLAAFPSAQVGR
jgi:hypothetical protein